MFNGRLIVSVSGDGGCGKSTVAKALAEALQINYVHPTSSYARDKIWAQIQKGEWSRERHGNIYRGMEHYAFEPRQFDCESSFYEQRSHYRDFWGDWIGNYNRAGGGARLYIDAIEGGEQILDGIRKKREFENIRGCIDLSIWIDAPGIPRDTTQQYGPEMCDIILRNDRYDRSEMSRQALVMRIHTLVASMRRLTMPR